MVGLVCMVTYAILWSKFVRRRKDGRHWRPHNFLNIEYLDRILLPDIILCAIA